jgi:hypothetical protein
MHQDRVVQVWPAGRGRNQKEWLGGGSCKRQKEVGGFIHQQDYILLGGVVREERPGQILVGGGGELNYF